MPTYVPDLPYAAQFTISGTFQGQPWSNVWHAFVSALTAIDLPILTAMMNAVADETFANPSLLTVYSLLDNDLLVTGIQAVKLHPAGPLVAEKSMAVSGASSGTDSNSALSLILKSSTGFAGRRFRGRTFLPGMNDGMRNSGDPNHVDPAFGATAVTAAEDAQTALQGINCDYGVLSRAVPGGSIAAITSWSTNPVFGIQRRRRPST